VRDRPGHVHDDRRLRRTRGRWGVLDDHDRLSVSAMEARESQNEDGDRRDCEEDEDRSAHAWKVSDTRRRA
jgi:hypothetical protein